MPTEGCIVRSSSVAEAVTIAIFKYASFDRLCCLIINRKFTSVRSAMQSFHVDTGVLPLVPCRALYVYVVMM